MDDAIVYDTSGGDGALLFGRILDGRGGAEPVSWDKARIWQPSRTDGLRARHRQH